MRIITGGPPLFFTMAVKNECSVKYNANKMLFYYSEYKYSHIVTKHNMVQLISIEMCDFVHTILSIILEKSQFLQTSVSMLNIIAYYIDSYFS